LVFLLLWLEVPTLLLLFAVVEEGWARASATL
jgi:hypothetical protein